MIRKYPVDGSNIDRVITNVARPVQEGCARSRSPV